MRAAAAESLQSCPTPCDPIDGSPPGSPVPGVLQATTLEWVAISSSNASRWKVKGKLQRLKQMKVHGAKFSLSKVTMSYSQGGLQNYFIAQGHTNGLKTKPDPVFINPRSGFYFWAGTILGTTERAQKVDIEFINKWDFYKNIFRVKCSF